MPTRMHRRSSSRSSSCCSCCCCCCCSEPHNHAHLVAWPVMAVLPAGLLALLSSLLMKTVSNSSSWRSTQDCRSGRRRQAQDRAGDCQPCLQVACAAHWTYQLPLPVYWMPRQQQYVILLQHVHGRHTLHTCACTPGRQPDCLPLPPPLTYAVQVEHGITEMVNGFVDIVEWMLRLQLGHFMQPLDFDVLDKEIKRSGWSIEVRTSTVPGTLGVRYCTCKSTLTAPVAPAATLLRQLHVSTRAPVLAPDLRPRPRLA
jgi:hypothetical protein